VELGFKEARPWPENAKFQFWPSCNVILQRKLAIAYAAPIATSLATFLAASSPGMLQGRKLHSNLVWTESKSALFQYFVRSSTSNFASNFSGSFLCFGSSS
ncbi:hypothetical protein PIB30_103711, partial [Stylosanthes scabra]|nr:hypothetical protein [Stylosanthes scabra]